jgi:hypothetical protein
VNTNKLNIDIIKRKIEKIVDKLKIPIIGFFAILPNCFMKPHTGMWKLLNAYYKTYGNSSIHNAVVVSNEGGMIIENEKKGIVTRNVCYSDIDRAFAHNIGMKYQNIDEFLGYDDKFEFSWDNKIIPPEVRELYIEQINKLSQPNIFKELGKFGDCDIYVIMVMGAPRCGKTLFAKMILSKWKKSLFGHRNAVHRLGMDKYTNKLRLSTFKKHIDDRISVILDGNCHTDELRNPYLDHIKNTNIPILCVEVNCGLEMAKVFNHSHVEETTGDKIYLYKTREYNIYKSMYKKPKTTKNLRYILYPPNIEERDAIMKYRY